MNENGINISADDYSDIIHLPHHTSQRHPRMSRESRAAQFAPFAALTGYEDSVNETARYTDSKIELGEDEIARLDRKLNFLSEHSEQEPVVTVTYFSPDKKKAGGCYLAVNGRIKRVDPYSGKLTVEGNAPIPMCDILKLEGEIFEQEGTDFF